MNTNILTLTPEQLAGHATTLGDRLTALNREAQLALAAVATHNAQPGAVQLDINPLGSVVQAVGRGAAAAWNHQKLNCERLAKGSTANLAVPAGNLPGGSPAVGESQTATGGSPVLPKA